MADAPDPVRAAIEARLKGTAGLTTLLGTPTAVYHRKAPQPARPPVVVFDQRSSLKTYAFHREAFRTETWIVRGVAFGRTADRADAIAEQIDLALEDAPLSVTGRRLLYLRQESEVDYPEQIGKEIFQHKGAVYRIITEPT